MGANKFATLVHRKTNRFTLLLIYAFLEWTLIFFLLLNSLFSVFILRFSDFFGLKRPCLFCSRLDRFFHSSRESPSFRDLLCHDHTLQLSRIRFCPTHQSFAESGDFCEDCSSSCDLPKHLLQRCSCCGASVENRPSINPDSGYLGFSDDGIPIEEEMPIGVEIPVEQIRSDFFSKEENVGSVNSRDSHERNFTREEETEEKLPSEDVKRKEEESRGNQTVREAPSDREEEVNDGDDDNDAEEEFSCFISSFDCNKGHTQEKEEENEADLVMEVEFAPETSVSESYSYTDKPTEAAQKHLEFYIDGQDCHLIPVEFFAAGEEVRETSDSNGDVILDFGAESDFAGENVREDEEAGRGSSADDFLQMGKDEEDDAEVSIGTEIPDHEQIDDAPSSREITPQDHDDDLEQAEEALEFRTVTLETKRPLISVALQLDEDKNLPETPVSADSPHSPRNTYFHLNRRDSGAEDSLDDAEIDGNLTNEKLVFALREERKALNALYAELEEERSASAIAAHETMAMINRLQEEKAAMQMEALQYQRMMEEQSEYDQEALQLMNELVVKREKEKAELEKELDLYRKRLEEYESNENMRILRRRRDSSVESYRNGDLDQNSELQHKKDGINENSDSDGGYGVIEVKRTPADDVLCLEECLDDFEGERLSILGRLKVLEEKLSALNDEEEDGEEILEDAKAVDNGHTGGNRHFHTKEMNGKHKVLRSKRLLPLFDAAEVEVENGLSNGHHHENGDADSENGRITMEEEIDELYERLEALEADREFMRHCVGSLRKGEKGIYLLQQILQHLRDLRNVELQVRDAGDVVL